MEFEFLKDWKFWAFAITIIGLIINWLASQKIANNHLAHMDEKLDKIDEKVETGFKEIKTTIQKHEVDIAVLKEKQKIK